MMKYILDTSVIVDASIIDYFKNNKLEAPIEIVIPNVVASEIEYQANPFRKIPKRGTAWCELLLRHVHAGPFSRFKDQKTQKPR